ncbi:MAG: TatD family hydrolase, partial [Kofleriaceae bacterium]
MIDTHCHLDLPAFDADRDAVVARAQAAGVTGILVPAIRPRTWDALVELVRGTSCLRHAIGIHPQIVPDLEPAELAGLEQRLADACSTAIAVGECGLDGSTSDRELQALIFRTHLRVARALDRPLVIHVLRAHDLAPRILREEGPVRGILHSYSGGADLVPVYAALGMAFSFAGPVTYTNARKPIEAARVIPAELLLVETDAPDQAPAAHRGSRSEPAFIVEVVAALARVTGREPSEVAALT